MFCQLNLISKKAPLLKCAKMQKKKKKKKISNIEIFFLARFAHSAFYKIHNSGAAKRHTPVQYAQYVVVFFLSSHHDTNPLPHLYQFLNQNIIIHWLILTVNHQRVIFSLFCLHPVGQTFLYPSKFYNHLKHSAK